MDKRRVYIVEDEGLVAMHLADRLTSMGYVVCGKAARGEAALDEIPLAHPDAVLMDIRLAGKLSGIETAARLRDVPVVFLTANTDDALVQEAAGAEPFGYLTKPFEERALHASLQVAIHKHAAQRHQDLAGKLQAEAVIVSGVAHEFNNLLQVIIGHLSLLQLDQSPQNGNAGRSLQAAMRAAQTAGEITRTLLVYTQREPMDLRPTDLNAFLSENAEALRALAEPHALVIRPGEKVPQVDADKAQLAAVLKRLVVNSVEAMGSRKGTIEISAGVTECDHAAVSQNRLGEILPPGTYVFLEVADDGCGMDAPTLREAFAPFFTTKASRKGLGLAFVHGIVRAHSGGVFTDSTPGQGARVRVVLPVRRLSPGAKTKAEGGWPPSPDPRSKRNES